MPMQPSEEQGNSNQAEPVADIENVCGSVGSASSQSRGAPAIAENSEEEVHYQHLLRAAIRGNWEIAGSFFYQYPASKMAKMTSRSETVLHIAALSAQDQFLENLIELLSPYPEALEMVDCDGRTALHNAVLCGRIRMVKALIRSNPKLIEIADNEGRVPSEISALEGSMYKEIAWFLAESTLIYGRTQPSDGPFGIGTVIDLTYAGHHDIALYLVSQCPQYITMKSTRHEGASILDALASMESHFPSGTRLSVLEEFIYKCTPVDLNYNPTYEASRNMQMSTSCPVLQCITRLLWNATKIVVPKRIYEMKLRHMMTIKLAKVCCIANSGLTGSELTGLFEERGLLAKATVRGISELVNLVFQFFPELIAISPDRMQLMTYAVRYRQERTVRLFLKVSSTNESSLVTVPTIENSRRMMAAAARYNPESYALTNVAGAAFQIQRELQWYKAVESWTIPRVRNTRYDGTTFWHLFLKSHKELLEKGEKWVKDTANSCMLVSTLIATVLFAAAFTVPGGNDGNTGVPLMLGHDSLVVFAISDALGLFSSVTAILLFLAILTSRYEPQDFLHSLPRNFIVGLSFLFLSLAFMLVAFATTLTMVLDRRVKWILIPITLLASLLVALFARLQLPLLYQMAKSTYGPSIFHPKDI